MKKTIYSDAFESFWASFSGSFGGKGSKKKADDVFSSLKIDSEDLEMLISAVDRQTQEKQRALESKAFIAPFQEVHRWLSKERWDDDPIRQEIQLSVEDKVQQKLRSLGDRSWAD